MRRFTASSLHARPHRGFPEQQCPTRRRSLRTSVLPAPLSLQLKGGRQRPHAKNNALLINVAALESSCRSITELSHRCCLSLQLSSCTRTASRSSNLFLLIETNRAVE